MRTWTTVLLAITVAALVGSTVLGPRSVPGRSAAEPTTAHPMEPLHATLGAPHPACASQDGATLGRLVTGAVPGP